MDGTIDQITATQIGGWFKKTIAGETVTLKLLINGELIQKDPLLSEPMDHIHADGSAEVLRFVYDINETDHHMSSCEIEVLGFNDHPLAPSPLKFDPRQPALKKSWAVTDIDNGVRQIIENTHTAADLQGKLALLASWFGYAVDRASALTNLEAQHKDTIRNFLENSGNLGGTLGHLMGLIQTRYPTIRFKNHTDPSVSIIIPVHNKFDLTYNCLKSISDHPGNSTFEIIIVDDLSSDETLLSSLVFSGAVRIVRNPQNYGFVGSCNAGAEVARGTHLFFLNNDTLMRDNNWLDSLLETSLKVDNAGIVGSRLLFADGKLQECGGIIWRDGSGWNWGRGGDPNDWRYRYRRDVDYVSGAALLIRKDLFESLDGFDSLYSPAYYEDTDLCFRVRAAGYRVIVQPASTIIHLEGQSAGTDTSRGMKRYQVVNARKFFTRWEGTLARHQPNAVDPQVAAERYVGKSVLFIDDSILTPDRDAGSNAALQHILSIQRLGYKVVFVPAHNMAEIPPYTQRLEAQGVECIFAPNFWSVEDFLRRDKREFELIYIHRFGNADKYINLCRSHRPAAAVVYNVADLHSLRDQRAASLKNDKAAIVPQGAVDSDRELDLIESADTAIVHSPYEKEFILAKRPAAKVEVVSWAVQTATEVVPFAERTGIAFVGGFNHMPNVDAVVWYLKSVHPIVRTLVPDLKFFIVGSHMPSDFRSLAIDGVEATGYVEDIDTFVSHLTLTVAPLRYGAGIKGKVLTSLAQGTPCVMSTVAAEGLNLPQLLREQVADDPKRMADHIANLVRSSSKWSDLCWEGIDFIEAEFSRAAVDTQMKAVEAGSLKSLNSRK